MSDTRIRLCKHRCFEKQKLQMCPSFTLIAMAPQLRIQNLTLDSATIMRSIQTFQLFINTLTVSTVNSAAPNAHA